MSGHGRRYGPGGFRAAANDPPGYGDESGVPQRKAYQGSPDAAVPAPVLACAAVTGSAMSTPAPIPPASTARRLAWGPCG
jgi:hypothetical protein